MVSAQQENSNNLVEGLLGSRGLIDLNLGPRGFVGPDIRKYDLLIRPSQHAAVADLAHFRGNSISLSLENRPISPSLSEGFPQVTSHFSHIKETSQDNEGGISVMGS